MPTRFQSYDLQNIEFFNLILINQVHHNLRIHVQINEIIELRKNQQQHIVCVWGWNQRWIIEIIIEYVPFDLKISWRNSLQILRISDCVFDNYYLCQSLLIFTRIHLEWKSSRWCSWWQWWHDFAHTLKRCKVHGDRGEKHERKHWETKTETEPKRQRETVACRKWSRFSVFSSQNLEKFAFLRFCFGFESL